LFRGFPLVASNMAFKRPLYFGDVTILSSKVEKFGNTSFVVSHEFHQGEDPAPVAVGNEVRVWGYSDANKPEKLIAQSMPDDLKAMLSADRIVDTTV